MRLLPKLSALGLSLLLASASGQGAAAQSLTELFTSQGCSSCPPADRLVFNYVKQRNVIPLTFNVDYWDYLGWKDTLAKPSYSKRQADYAKARGDNNRYTPQTVVNGITHVVGSRKNDIDRAIRKTNAALAPHRVPMTVKKSNGRLQISLGAKPTGGKFSSATIWMARVTPRVDVAIKRGENAGSAISYYNVVRQLQPVGMWDGKPKTVKLPLKHLISEGTTTCVVFLQAGAHGPVIAVAEWRNQPGS